VEERESERPRRFDGDRGYQGPVIYEADDVDEEDVEHQPERRNPIDPFDHDREIPTH
jgi:hypothetical protein